MKCQVCGKDVIGTCICGYCTNCIKKYTHDGCKKLVENKEKENDKV